MKRFLLVMLLLLLPASLATADDLTGADSLLCSPAQATACSAEEGCETAPPWTWDIPSFIEIELDKKVMRTTAASNENRSTPIPSVQRTGGLIFLQGVERGRAFSFVIEETTGLATVAVARDGFTVSVFGACTKLAR
jgi:hypothetical protein